MWPTPELALRLGSLRNRPGPGSSANIETTTLRRHPRVPYEQTRLRNGDGWRVGNIVRSGFSQIHHTYSKDNRLTGSDQMLPQGFAVQFSLPACQNQGRYSVSNHVD